VRQDTGAFIKTDKVGGHDVDPEGRVVLAAGSSAEEPVLGLGYQARLATEQGSEQGARPGVKQAPDRSTPWLVKPGLAAAAHDQWAVQAQAELDVFHRPAPPVMGCSILIAT
jgi:hypothetical protein